MDQTTYRVLAEGHEVLAIETHEDAQNMVDIWNHAYPESEGFVRFVLDRPCADKECGYCE